MKTTTFQIQVTVYNYEGGRNTLTYEISLMDLNKFTDLAKAININSSGEKWNWFGKGEGLPKKWNGNQYVLDEWMLHTKMINWFDWKMDNHNDVNLVKEFFLRFTPDGADSIENIKFFKVEEIEL